MFSYTTAVHSSPKWLFAAFYVPGYTHTHSLYALFKYTALERQGAANREKLEGRVAELEKKLAEQEGPGDTAAEVRSRT